MIAPRHLARAPIKEGIIELRITSENPITAEILDSKYAAFSARYPKKETLKTGGWKISIAGDKAISEQISKNEIGFRYTSSDGRNIVQFRTNGFSFSRLEPYQTWEDMRDEALSLWKVYLEVAKPVSVTRIGTRYINVMNIPAPVGDFSDYLVAPPEIPDALPQGVSSFLSRIVLHDPALKANCVLMQVCEGIADDVVPLVLDIDVFVSGLTSCDAATNECWDVLDKLRHFKNKIFFESITEKTAELFQ